MASRCAWWLVVMNIVLQMIPPLGCTLVMWWGPGGSWTVPWDRQFHQTWRSLQYDLETSHCVFGKKQTMEFVTNEKAAEHQQAAANKGKGIDFLFFELAFCILTWNRIAHTYWTPNHRADLETFSTKCGIILWREKFLPALDVVRRSIRWRNRDTFKYAKRKRRRKEAPLLALLYSSE